jgi:hypothetical protein
LKSENGSRACSPASTTMPNAQRDTSEANSPSYTLPPTAS